MSEQDAQERRAHARVHVQADVEVGGTRRRVHAVLREIGRASARVIVAELPGQPGELVQLLLPGPTGVIEVLSEVERMGGAAPALELILTFAMVEPGQRKALDQLLELLLAGTGGGARQAPRVARRLEVRLASHGGRAAMLVDLSRGGLGIVVVDSMALGETVRVRLPTSDGELVIAGKVVNQRPVNVGGLDTYQTGVAFHPLDAATAAALERFIADLLR
jgi:hypothetical protein